MTDKTKQPTLQELHRQYIAGLKKQQTVSEDYSLAKEKLNEAEDAFQKKLDELLEQNEELAQLHKAKQQAEEAVEVVKTREKSVKSELKKVDADTRGALSRVAEPDDLPEGFKIQRRKTIAIRKYHEQQMIEAAITHNHSLLQINQDALQDWLKLCNDDNGLLVLPDYLAPFKEHVLVYYESQPTIYKSTLKKLELPPEPVTVSPTGDNNEADDSDDEDIPF